MASAKRRIVGSTLVRELAEASREELDEALEGSDDDDSEMDAEIDKAMGVGSLEEVVKKHRDPKPRPKQARPHGHRLVPPSDEDPSMRDGPSMGAVLGPDGGFEVEDAPDLSDGKIRSLEDLMARYPFDGTGMYFIRVVRKKPQSWQGHQCAGVMRQITTTLDQEEFTEIYGGGDYGLTVYGPPRTGGLIDPSTGRKKPKALTAEISYQVPYDASGVAGIPPNPDAALPSEEALMAAGDYDMEERSFRPPSLLRRPATPADASIHRATLEDARISRDREVVSAATAEVARARVDERKLELDAESNNNTIRLLEKQLDQARQSNQQTDVAALIEAIGGITSKSDNGAGVAKMLDNARKEMERSLERHNEEMQRVLQSNERERIRLIEQHQQDLDRQATLHKEEKRLLTKEVSDERDQREKLLKEERDSREKALKEERDRHEREIERIKAENDRVLEREHRENERRTADIERQNAAALAMEKSSHERELRALMTSSEGTSRTEKVVLEERIRIANETVAETKAEAARLRQELADKSDLVAQMEKFSGVAAAMGFVKPDGAADGAEPADDWKTQFAAIAKELAVRAPDLMRAAGEMVQKNRTPPAAAAPPPNQPPLLVPAYQAPRQPMRFATEHDPVHVPNQRVHAAPLPVTASMYPAPAESEMTAIQPVMSHDPGMMMPVTPMQSMQQVVPMQEAPPQEAPAPESEPTDGISDADIMQFVPHLEQAFTQKLKPKAFVDQLKATFPIEVIQNIASLLSASRVLGALRRNQPGSVLMKLNGKQWLKGLEKEAKAAVPS